MSQRDEKLKQQCVGEAWEVRFGPHMYTPDSDAGGCRNVVMVMMMMGMRVTWTMVAFTLWLYDDFAPRSYVPARRLVMHMCRLLWHLQFFPSAEVQRRNQQLEMFPLLTGRRWGWISKRHICVTMLNICFCTCGSMIIVHLHSFCITTSCLSVTTVYVILFHNIKVNESEMK